ncbi:MAG: metal-dependent hydrolase [Gallionella sp.]|nr:metal-dependent hydrolase [Gallionella sp.]
MPTIISHAAVPLALGLGCNIVSRRLLFAGLAACALPDLDVLAFRLGVAYSDQLGHRGFSHSLLFAALLGVLAALFACRLKTRRLAAFVFVSVAAASHGLLDMLTNGGLGVAYLWPFSDQRFFLSEQVIQVAPLSLRRLFGPAGLAVARSELLWVWLPACCVLSVFLLARGRNAP